MFYKCDYSIPTLTNEPLILHHKKQRFFGFIGDPIEQLKLSANLSRFCKHKLTRDSPGECGSCWIKNFNSFRVKDRH